MFGVPPKNVSQWLPALRRPALVIAAAMMCWSSGAMPAFAQHDHASALPHDIPDFCAVPGRLTTAGSGNWSSPATWSGGIVPGSDDVVVIGAGHNVRLDAEGSARVVCVEGRLAFAHDANTRLTVGTMLVKAGGDLEIGTAATPIYSANTAEIIIANTPLNDPLAPGFDLSAIDASFVSDPEQYGTGLIGVGRVTVHGARKSPTWIRLAAEPLAGHTTLRLSEPVSSWNAGDRVILPDTRHLRFDDVGDNESLSAWTRKQGQWEELTVQSISADGLTITLNEALQYSHHGARDADGRLRLLPHVGNLSRNVVIRSEVPFGGDGVQGHAMFTARADVDIRYATFRELGRTRALDPTDHINQIGRYPVHFHHLMGPTPPPANGHQYTFVGNAIDGGSSTHNRRWAVAIHNTHYGLVSDNVAYNYAGALFTTEDGSESYNVIERNFAVRGSGTGGRLGHGNEGMGFWFRGPNNYVRGNVAADLDSDDVEAAYGFKYFMHGQCDGCTSLAEIAIPTAPGQDPAEYRIVNGNALPILQFENNEVYSAAEGLTYWWLGSTDPIPSADPKPSVFKDLRIWHVYNIGVYHYPGARVLFDGLQIFGGVFENPTDYACCSRGFHGEDYAATDVRIINAEIHNMWSGIIPSAAGTGLQIVENSDIHSSRWSGIGIDTMFSANGGGWLPQRRIILNNVRFRGATTIAKEWNVRSETTSNVFQTDQLLVYGYQGNAADNFEMFYAEQATQSLAGGIAPCALTRPETVGLVCQTDASRGPVMTWLDPWEGSIAGGTLVEISGAGFKPGAMVTFDDLPATVISNTPNKLRVMIPAHAAGAVTVRVANTDLRGFELPSHYLADTNDGPVQVPIGFLYANVAPPPPANTAPVAVDDAYETSQNTLLNIPAPGVLANDTDADSNPLTAVLVSGPSNGSLTLNANGSISYTPNAGFTGSDSFTYTAHDGSADSIAATVFITVNAMSVAPVAANDFYRVDEDTTLNVSAPGVLGNDSDADGDPLSAVRVSGPSAGVLTLNSDGSFSYTPFENVNGSDSFSYRANGGSADSNVATVSITITPVNDSPTANDDARTMIEDGAEIAFDVLANDSPAPEPESLSAAPITLPAKGALRVGPEGRQFFYRPNANFCGTDSFDYRVSDGNGGTDTATVTITVTCVNDLPTAIADTFTVPEDSVNFTLDVLANDSAANVDVGERLNVDFCGIEGGVDNRHGTVTIAPDRSHVIYTPDRDFFGVATFTCVVGDAEFRGPANGGSTARVTVNVTPVNDAPVANAQNIATNEDTALAITLVATDVDSASLTYTIVSGPSNGTLSGTAPNLIYTPNLDYFGPDSFSLSASDGSAVSNIATVVITINPINDAPLAASQSVTTNEDEPVSITLAATDVDSGALTFTILSGPSHGTLSGTAPNVIYTPELNYNGPDAFTYVASDGAATSNIATVSIAVSGVNDAPVAADDAYSTAEDAQLEIPAERGVLENDVDVDGDSLTAILVSQASHGTVTLNADGSFSYLPALNYSGSDSFTYKANDGLVESNVVTVSITVDAANDPPTAGNDSYSADEDGTLTVGAPGVLGTDADPDGDPLAAMLVSGPSHGTLTLNPDGSFRYTPALNYNGPDSFTYKANDGSADSDVATVSITVIAVNDAPVADDDSHSVAEDGTLEVAAPGVLGGDTDIDGDLLRAIVVGGPANGTLSLNGDGSFTYAPAPNFSGTDQFTYKASDGTLDSNVATVTITVGAENDAPAAGDDAYKVVEDGTLNTPAPGVLGNDSDAEGNALTAIVVSGPAHGVLTLNPDGSFSYTPDANYNGTDAFSYKANDGTADSNVATVTIAIDAVNDAPVAGNDAFSIAEDMALTVTAPGVLGNDTDAEGQSLSATMVSGPSSGVLTLNSDGSFSYTPNANFHGTDSFTYRASDGSASSNTATVTITVSPVNDAPTIVTPADQAGIVGATVSLTVLAQDVDGDTLQFSATGLPGGLSIDPLTGVISGTLTTAGPYVVTVTVSDGIASASATFNWTVQPAGTGVLAQPPDQTNQEGDRIVLTLQTTLPERDGRERRRFTAVGLPQDLRIERDGTIEGRLKRGSAGEYTVVATVTLGSTTASVTFKWTVTPSTRLDDSGPGSENSGPGSGGSGGSN